jgi:cell wall-associated NlpC family hydrolase/prophage tail gpP-like protein
MHVIATVETLWSARQYSRRHLPLVEDYTIDSAMDTDADQFTVTLGDPQAQLMSLFRRNGEVRIQLSGTYDGGKTFVPLLKGYADTVDVVHDGTLTLTGRDLSAAAIDDTAEPWSWGGNPRPGKIILKQAKNRGFSRFGGLLRHPEAIKPLPNPLYTDGSETVWALWYRMIREKRMWIWTQADGTLMVNPLNYANKPKYLFGWPSSHWPNYVHSKQWIPVMEAEETKNTQTRIHEVWVYSNNGKQTFPPVKTHDPTTDNWLKKPLSIIPAQANVHNPSQAMKQAQEELFEGKVGEIEILIRITDPGFVVRQNEVCLLNIPKMGLSGEFFIVGVRLLNGTTGAIQEIRLREKHYALTKRIPLPPGTTSEDGSQNLSDTSMGSKLGLHGSLGSYFVEAAKEFHGPWQFDLFLATLLAICDTETGFKNVREGSDIPWYKKPGTTVRLHRTGTPTTSPGALDQWHRDFANEKGNPLNPYRNRSAADGQAGVGYFQLTSESYKIHADSITGVHDEYEGGRWNARANILTGGYVLANKLKGRPVDDNNFWIGVQAYNSDTGNQGPYSKLIKQKVNGTYLREVQSAEASSHSGDPSKTGFNYNGPLPDQVKRIIHYAENQVGKGYRLGTEGPTTFDCSGLAYASYKAAGLASAIGGRESTWGYWGNSSGGKARNHDQLVFVHVDDLAPGDMVFFDIPSDGGVAPQHMGIYYHDNLMIAAENPSIGVRITSIHGEPGSVMGGMRIKGMYPDVQSPNHPGANP